MDRGTSRQAYTAAHRRYRERRRDLPLAADGAPQWGAQEWLEEVTDLCIRRSCGDAGPYDLLADRQWHAQRGRSLKDLWKSHKRGFIYDPPI